MNSIVVYENVSIKKNFSAAMQLRKILVLLCKKQSEDKEKY